MGPKTVTAELIRIIDNGNNNSNKEKNNIKGLWQGCLPRKLSNEHLTRLSYEVQCYKLQRTVK